MQIFSKSLKSFVQRANAMKDSEASKKLIQATKDSEASKKITDRMKQLKSEIEKATFEVEVTKSFNKVMKEANKLYELNKKK